MMKKGRRVITSVIAGCMIFGMLTACGNNNDTASEATNAEETAAEETTAEETTSEETETTDGGIKVTMILSDRDEWLSEMETGALEAAEELGINLVTADAQQDTSKMLQFIETAKNDGQTAVIVNMVDPETGQECIDAAGDMKLVFVNRYPTDLSLLGEDAVYVGSNENEAGDLQAEYLTEYFEEKGMTEIKYILLSGNYGLTATTLRTNSALDGLEARGLVATEATAPLVADYNRAEAQDKIAPVLDSIEYDCIIANNDAMALGAVEAILDKGGDPAEVPIVGIDASTDGRKSIADGQMAMSAFQDAVGQGRTALIAAKNLLEGNTINEGTGKEIDEENEYIIWVPFERVDATNVADYD